MDQGNFTFISPSVEFKITNLTSVEEIAGLTFYGVVGEFPKGPAFEPFEIPNKDIAYRLVGAQNTTKFNNKPKYPAIYGVNQFLEEANNVTAVRVLGLSGHNAGNGWAITVNGGVDPDTVSETLIVSGDTETVTGGTFQGATLPDLVGGTLTIEPDYVRVGAGYTGTTYDVTVVGYTGSTETHEIVYDEYSVSADPLAEYEDRVVAVIRSRGRYNNETLEFDTETLQISGGTGDILYSPFTLQAVNSTTNRSETYQVSLNPSSRDYISKVIGTKNTDGNSMIYVEKTYDATLAKYNNDDLAHSVKTPLVELTDTNFTDYNEQYRGADTPWVVSELRGNKVDRLFKVYTIGDGAAANSDVKISIQNINPDTKEFDVIVRSFNDTDNRLDILESYRRCTMNESLDSFVGKRIGSVDLSTGQYIYDRRSDYVYIVIDDKAPSDAFPAGFEGYFTKSFAAADTGFSSDAKEPQIFYKTSYGADENPSRSYLGITENAYTDSLNGRTTNINQDFFDYFGVQTADNVVKTKGFHMDSGTSGTTYVDGLIEIGEFESGEASFKDINDIIDTENPYSDINKRKFTFVPAGGFDGWDIWRTKRTNTDLYAKGKARYTQNNDWDAYAYGIDLMSNAEEVEMNVFTTPNIDWFENLSLVNRAIDMIERARGDSFYIIDPPDLQGAGMATDLAELFAITGIDSTLCATYGPWVEFNDNVNRQYIYLPPSQLIVKPIALTDNRTFPWFAPAGVNRGRVDARRTRKKLSKPERDILYNGRINPIADFKVGGVTIFGQKTTQVAENALDRINVIRLILTARKTISNISRDLLFDPNDEVVRSQFETRVNAYLSRVKRDRGLFDFKIVSDGLDPAVIDRNEMLYKLLIKPTRALEYIGIEFVVTPTGASFSDVVQTL